MNSTDAEVNTSASNESDDTAQDEATDSELPDSITNGERGDRQGLFRVDAVYESLRYGEYDLKYGIAEFGDNSLDAGANNIWVHIEEIEKEFDGRELEVVGQVAVADDGCGMDEEELRACLVLGETLSPGRGGDRQIGRFGVGMTMAAISLARRIEVYSRADADEPFRYVHLDLDEIEEGSMNEIPEPDEKQPPEKFASLLEGKTGTVVVLKKTDRLQHDPGAEKKGIRASEQVEGMSYFLGRTYRKFISAGRNFWYNGDKVYLHDPLYMDGPTYTDEKTPGGPDEKAELRGNVIRIPLDVPDTEKEEKEVTVRISVLPEEWREERGSGDTSFAKKRKIHKNEGISVLRAGREVLYGKVPYLIGKRGQSKYKNIDRWWGLEISFPPELDDYFEVRYIKRGAQPVSSVRDQIKDRITNAIETIREDEIQAHWSTKKREESAERGAYADAEDAMAEAEKMLPTSQRGADQTEEEAEQAIEDMVEQEASSTSDSEDESTDSESEDESTDEKKEERKEEIKSKPYSIIPTEMSQSVFFEPEFLPGKIIIKLNTQHPFYKKVFAPLCGNLTQVEEGDEFRNFVEDGDTEEQRLARKALLLLLFSYAKGESMFADKSLTSLFSNLRTQWGTALGTVLSD